MAEIGIEARGLTVTYRNGFTALRDASFTVPPGSITALVGVNGAGKSTLFKALMGFVPAAKGEVRVLGLPVPDALPRNRAAPEPALIEVLLERVQDQEWRQFERSRFGARAHHIDAVWLDCHGHAPSSDLTTARPRSGAPERTSCRRRALERRAMAQRWVSFGPS